MRLHRLSMVAFGSFPGTEEVDFDALGEAGLFLIHGPTGAGKTTVLDAVCYALYGRVPGQRESARSLRCDHAPPSRGPSVTLEATIRGRRLRVTRSPAWMRPKLRGSGLVEEKAKALVEELTEPGGRWVARSTRSDEAGDFIGTLTGMNAAQFCQVALLPQGDFAKFLRAGGEERRELLERLFSVRVFGEVERWLADHRTRSGREAQELAQRVDSVLDRMRGAAGDLALPEDAADPEAWSGEVLSLAEGALAHAATACAASQAGLLSARSRLEEGRALADRQRRHAAALARSQELDAAADERSDLEAMLDEAARADRVLPLVRQAEQRAEAAAKARRVAADAVLRAFPGNSDGASGGAPERPNAGAVRPGLTRGPIHGLTRGLMRPTWIRSGRIRSGWPRWSGSGATRSPGCARSSRRRRACGRCGTSGPAPSACWRSCPGRRPAWPDGSPHCPGSVPASRSGSRRRAARRRACRA